MNLVGECAEHYEIQIQNGADYLILEHKSGDYSYLGKIYSYYVFRRKSRWIINKEGDYKDIQNVRWDILSCERTESMEYVQTGTDTQIIDGETVEIPVYEQQVVINKGWDEYSSLEQAIQAYGLIYKPIGVQEWQQKRYLKYWV